MRPRSNRCALVTAAVSLTLMLSGCGDDDAEPPETAPLEAPEEPVSPTSRTFSIDPATSSVDFLMEAPLENIHGTSPGSFEGDLFVDLADLTRSRGLVRIDLDPLEIFQRKRETEDEELGEETKNETQNAHARTWLQISDDTPADVRTANRYIQFNITRVSDASATDVLSMEGAERVVTATVHGDFRLHGRTTQKAARVELTFAFAGDAPSALRVRTLEPVPVGLAEHAIRPRSAFDALAEATLSTLGQKVAEAAPVTFELTARAGEAIEEMPETAIEASLAAEEAAALGVEPEEPAPVEDGE